MINIENFTKLAKYLRSLPDDYDRFDMSHYHKYTTGLVGAVYDFFSNIVYSADYDPSQSEHIECGTVACALGHGPAAGVTTTSDDWMEYYLANFSGDHYVYDWCFHNDWVEIDNTHQGAALRIELMLKMHPEFDVIELTEQYKDITGLEFEQ